MPASEREVSRDRELRLQHSNLEGGRSSVPMWDSSDPDRAPPPLPLNPGASSPTTKANTSTSIAAAAKQIVERARESAPISSYTQNSRAATPSSSPEKSLVKGAHHRRLQTLSTSNVKDLRTFLDNRSPERSPERLYSPRGSFSRQDSREEHSFAALDRERSSTPTPSGREPLKDTPALRSSTRPLPRPLLGENTPPSATMLALQNTPGQEAPLNDITNGPSTPNASRLNGGHGSNEAQAIGFSSQLVTLTNIATSLQKEMAQLSRRSKDNATDLFSLKEATNQRDEDIRRSLRDLAVGMNGPALLGPPPSMTRSLSGFPSIMDSKPYTSPPSASKTSYTLPRAASAHSFLEDARLGSPSPFSVEGAASVAMLEKIIREMVTKEGQERLQTKLSELLEKSREDNSEATKNAMHTVVFEAVRECLAIHGPPPAPLELEINREDLFDAVKSSLEGASIPFGGFGDCSALSSTRPTEGVAMKDDLANLETMLREIQDNVADAKNKSREDDSEATKKAMHTAVFEAVRECLATHGPAAARELGISRDDLFDAVKTSLEDFSALALSSTRSAEEVAMKDDLTNLEAMLREIQGSVEDVRNKSREESSEAEATKQTIHTAVFEAVRECLAAHGPAAARELEISRDDLFDAVKASLDGTSIPFGGLGDCSALSSTRSAEGVAMKDDLTNLEIMLREVLDSALSSTRATEGVAMKDDLTNLEIMLREVLDSALSSTRTTEGVAMKDDLTNLEIMLREILDSALSSTRTTEGVAMKDDLTNLETMLREIQDNIDREQLDEVETVVRVTQETIDNLAERLENPTAAKIDVAAVEVLAQELKSSLSELLEKSREENSEVTKKAMHTAVFEAVRECFATHSPPARELGISRDDLFDAVKTSLEDSSAFFSTRSTEGLAMKDDLTNLETMLREIQDHVAGMKNTDRTAPAGDGMARKEDTDAIEILLHNTKAQLEEFAQGGSSGRLDREQLDEVETVVRVTQETIDNLAKRLENERLENSAVKTDVAAVEVLAQELKTSLSKLLEKSGEDNSEATKAMHTAVFEAVRECLATHGPAAARELMKDDLTNLETMLREIQDNVADVKNTDRAAPAGDDGMARKEDTDAIETLLHNTKAQLEELTQGGLLGRLDQLDEVGTVVRVTQETIENLAERLENSTAAKTDVFLRLSIDTLGTALTSFTSTYPETMDKIAEESRTVFNKVDDTFNKLEETQEGLKHEHAMTRDEVVQAVAAIGSLQSDVTEHNPRFMVLMKEVQSLVGQHFEQSQKSSEEHGQLVKGLQEQLKGLENQNEELKNNMTAFPALAAPSVSSETASMRTEKFDDTAIHEKLDKLVDQTQEAGGASVQLERLDQIHEKVMATAAEVSAFVAGQTKQITDGHAEREKQGEELAMLIERRKVQRDEIDDDITVLNEEKQSLTADVEALKVEKEKLASEKAHLNADLSALETALHIRREELHDMDRKAETIERRMLEGVMNQSRMLLLTKGATKSSPPKKKPQGRDLRAASTQTLTSTAPSLKPSHALPPRARPSILRNGPAPNSAERRIMSLN